MNINEIPSYVKHSEVYKTLVKKNVKIIANNGNKPIPLMRINNKMSFDDFKELLRTIYFWNIDIEEYPIEFYIFINDNLDKVKNYLKEHNNKLTKILLQFSFDGYFLASVISKLISPNEQILKKENLNLLKYIIENDSKNINEFFFKLCGFGNLNVIKYMVNTHKIDIYSVRDNGLRIAATKGYLDVVKFLFDKGADIHNDNDKALRNAASNGNLKVVEFLLENGADVNATDVFGSFGALINASKNGHLDVVKLLLKKGGDDLIHVDDENALHVAASHNHLSIVELLLDKGANIHSRNNSLLRNAVNNNYLDIVKFLLIFSVEINDNYNRSTLLNISKTTNIQIKNEIQNYIDEYL